MSIPKSSRILPVDGLRQLLTAWLLNFCQRLEQRLAAQQHMAPEQVAQERALILPFDRSSPSTRPERLLRMNAVPVREAREESPTETFLPALLRLEDHDRRATLSDALGRLSFYVKTRRR